MIRAMVTHRQATQSRCDGSAASPLVLAQSLQLVASDCTARRSAGRNSLPNIGEAAMLLGSPMVENESWAVDSSERTIRALAPKSDKGKEGETGLNASK